MVVVKVGVDALVVVVNVVVDALVVVVVVSVVVQTMFFIPSSRFFSKGVCPGHNKDHPPQCKSLFLRQCVRVRVRERDR